MITLTRKTSGAVRSSFWAKPSLLMAAALFAHSPQGAESEKAAANCRADRSIYQPGDTVNISCVGPAQSTIYLHLNSLTQRDAEEIRSETLTVSEEGLASLSWSIAPTARDEAIGIFVAGSFPNASKPPATFFRIASPGTLDTFRIEIETYDSQPVLLLNGGLSAEYTVAKAAASLIGAVAHSWNPALPGSGPAPVVSTPGFLGKSIEETVRLYDRLLGVDSEIENVIIAPGIPSIPYISRVLGAPVLPIHFLVSVDSIREVELMLQTARVEGLSAYGTVGYDTSLPMAVAWIKLLDLPGFYADFIERHKVKNVILLGATGVDDGETKARLVADGATDRYESESIYIMYPGTADDDQAALESKIADINLANLGGLERIADWESGIAPQQMQVLAGGVESRTSAEITVVVADQLIHLYDLATYTVAAHMRKNNGIPEDGGVRGIVLNPYLIGYPTYEHWQGNIPYVYWQGNPPELIANRAFEVARTAVTRYFPGEDIRSKEVWVNSTRNFGGFFAPAIVQSLRSIGFSLFRENDYSLDENWDREDGAWSQSELVFDALLWASENRQFELWKNSLEKMTLSELLEVFSEIPGIKMTPSH